MLPVTPNLLSHVAQRERRHTAADPVTSQRGSSPVSAPRVPCKREAMYQTVSAPTLVGSRTPERGHAAPSQPEGPTDEGDLKPGGSTTAPLQPPQQPQQLYQHGFGSMQDLMHLSQSTSVDSPASVVQTRATSLRSPLAPAPAPAAHPAAAEPPMSTDTAPAESVVTAAPACDSDAAAAAEHPVGDGPQAVSAATVAMPQLSERRGPARSTASAGDGDVTARTWSQQAAALREHSGVTDAEDGAEDTPTWMTSSPPPKAWISSAPNMFLCTQRTASAVLLFCIGYACAYIP